MNDLVDRFVMHVNTHEREPVWGEDAAPSVIEGTPDDYGQCDWRIKPYPNINWIETLEQRLNFRFPYLYRSLITRYIFPCFSVKLSRNEGIQLLSNTPEGTGHHELRERLLFDDGMDGMIPKLLEHGFLFFANPTHGAAYDPLCFDMNRTTGRHDHPIVRFYHENLFKRSHRNVKVHFESEMAGSLEELLIQILEKG